ncbi:hypothetical protein B2K_39265 [Paenibacillus mucilaginosus K02]|uniref:Uncharacterized protein n=1 Tax=Paenibacillus mucilaginosus K02 TaxID=997761 RepID=R9UPC6_9BACL|nr:hypothetical protein B2K_39265 [Paenibacillus mucilaginosus K02]
MLLKIVKRITYAALIKQVHLGCNLLFVFGTAAGNRLRRR